MAATVTMTAAFSGTESGTNEDFSLSVSTSETVEQKVKRTVLVTTTVTSILNFGASVAAGTMVSTNGVMIVNRDSTNYITIGLGVGGGDTCYLKIPAGKFFVLWTKDLDCNIAAGAFSSFNDITTISAQANTGSCFVDIIALD